MKRHALNAVVAVVLALGTLTSTGTSVVHADEAGNCPLDVAKRLAENNYKDWSYGPKASEKQVDCVQFLLAVVETLEGEKLKKEARTRILISDVSPQTLTKDDYKIVRDRDPRIKGIQKALVDLERGSVVELADAKPGDLIQYWMKRRDGTWFGHSGVLNRVTKDEQGVIRATIFGAHGSGSTSGQTCGVSKKPLDLIDENNRRIFLVRYKPKSDR